LVLEQGPKVKNPGQLFLQQLLNGITFFYFLSDVTLPDQVISFIKVQFVRADRASGHLNTAINEFYLAFRSEVYLQGIYKLRPPSTDSYNQYRDDTDKNYQFDLI